jgi:hypothetical protein
MISKTQNLMLISNFESLKQPETAQKMKNI